MKNKNRIILVIFCFLTHTVFATDKAQSPYLKILNKDSNIDRMPLLMTTVDAHISGLIAEVKVTQYYKNNGSIPLEAQYVFPGSKQAAVHQVTMKIGDRVLAAEIQEKQQARATYQKAKAEGKTTSLLEQKDPGLFSMMVANILPNDEIEVELIYTEKIIPENGKYKFTYPAINIPSVLNNKKGQSSIKNEQEMGFDMIIKLDSPIAINTIESMNHGVDLEYQSDKQATIVLDIKETLNFKDDFVIEYSLQGDQINTGLLVYEDPNNQESYFLMMVEPPKQVKSDELVTREYIFVMDSSGSMEGEPLQTAKEIAQVLLSELKDHELFNVVLFAGGSQLLSNESLSPTERNLKKANSMIGVSSSGGGTNLYSAIQKVNKIPLTAKVSRTLIVLTDGAIDTSFETLDLIRKNNHQQNLFVIGVSNYGNDIPAVEALSNAGNGQEFIITDSTQLARKQQAFLDYVRYPILTDIKIESLGFSQLDLQAKQLPDLFSKRPLFLTGKFNSNQKGSLQISGLGGKKYYQEIFDLARFPASDKNKSIKYLWAKEKVIALGDGYLYKNNETAKAIEQITELGLKYNLLTDYTSFVAVDNKVRNTESNQKVGNQAPVLDEVMVTGSGYGAIEDLNKKLLHKKLPQFGLDSNSVSADLKYNISKSTNKEALKNRKSITFVLGRDSNIKNQYYASAIELFKQETDYKTDYVVTDLTTLSEVKTYLAQNNINSPWGIINIVTHSSPWSGLSVKLKTNDEQILDVFTLNQELKSSSFTYLSDQIIDANTEIRMLGCALGKHQQLLKLLSYYFGGRDLNRPIMKSPFDYVFMSAKEQKIQTFKNGFALIHPKHQNSYQSLLGALKQKNLNLSLNEIDNWRQKPVQVSTSIPVVEKLHRLKAIELAKRQKSFQVYLNEIGGDWADFDWSFKKVNNTVEITGKAILMTQRVQNLEYKVRTSMDLDDESLTAIVYPN